MEVVDLTPQRDEATDIWSIGDRKITGSVLRAIAKEEDKAGYIRWLHSEGWDQFEIEVALNLAQTDEVRLAYEPGTGDGDG